jgi:3D-(3,5/4)-trihydroxycyclohexane-1,2-dione acylhydrolase (decyclizing)
MGHLRLTTAQALVRYLAAQQTEIDGARLPFIAGVFAIFGHGNVAGLGEALAEAGERLPTLRAHNEQAMAHAAIAFAKAMNRRRIMACTTSIGPGATNLVTAAAVARVNRLPVLLLPGDVFAGRRPDPVLQQIEDARDPTISANDCFKPVATYWDRITRPEQLLQTLPQAMRVLTDPAECGPVVLCLPQDVQAEAADFPESFFAPRLLHWRRPQPDQEELQRCVALLRQSQRPLLIAGGGVKYSLASDVLRGFVERHQIPACETQAGKGALAWDHPLNLGAIGVTGTAAANDSAREADLILAVGSRLQDFTTGSRALYAQNAPLIQLNISGFDAMKHGAVSLVSDACAGLEQLSSTVASWTAPARWVEKTAKAKRAWQETVDRVTSAPAGNKLPSDAQVLGAVNRQAGPTDVVVCAAGGLPGELHKLWRAAEPVGYHLEYGYSCMGYEIAGGLGVKLAHPDRRVFVLVGDGSYLMMNSEIATSVAMGLKLDIVVLDNRGFGCINRLQQACGGQAFNNLLDPDAGPIDFAAHARALGAEAKAIASISELEEGLDWARSRERTTVLVIETDPMVSTTEGGAWWDVPVPETSERTEVKSARRAYETAIRSRDKS